MKVNFTRILAGIIKQFPDLENPDTNVQTRQRIWGNISTQYTNITGETIDNKIARKWYNDRRYTIKKRIEKKKTLNTEHSAAENIETTIGTVDTSLENISIAAESESEELFSSHDTAPPPALTGSTCAVTVESEETLCVKWNDYHQNISSTLQDIRYEREFFDVTLASEDDQIQAHKVILSACSPFFRAILKKNKHEHPLIYLKGVKFTELLSILNFMYNGEVNIPQAELDAFLVVAEDLKIKGLCQDTSLSPTKEAPSQKRQSSLKSLVPVPKRRRPDSNKQQSSDKMSTQAKSVVLVKLEPGAQTIRKASVPEDGGKVEIIPVMEKSSKQQILEEEDQQDLHDIEILKESKEKFFRLVDPFMESTVGDTGKLWLCKACGHNSRIKHHIMNHIETKHSKGEGYSCPVCRVCVQSYHILHRHYCKNHELRSKDLNISLPTTSMPEIYLDCNQ